MFKSLLRILHRINLLKTKDYSLYSKTIDLIYSIKQIKSLTGEAIIFGKPFYFDPIRTSLQEIFGPSGLVKMYNHDNYFLSSLADKKSLVVLDIGSHIGIFPRVVKHLFPNSSIYSLEPDRDNFKILQMNNNQLTDTFSFQLGVYDNETDLELLSSDLNSWRSTLSANSSFFRTKTVGNDSFSHDKYKVKCTTIDNFIGRQQIRTLDLIGITVPGEIALSILNGCRSTLTTLRPNITISLYKTEVPSVLEFFESFNYELVRTTGSMHAFSSRD